MARVAAGYSHLTALFLGYFATGLMIPAMGLFVTSKGYSLFHLGLAILLYSATVLLFEVPSGIFCDAKGRKSSYQIGLGFSLLGSLCILSQSLMLLFVGFFLTGLGRAFQSGSLDALLIEEQLRVKGELQQVLVAMEICSSVALAVGSFAGGYLLSLGRKGLHLSDFLLVSRMAILFLNMILVGFLVKKDQKPVERKVSLKTQANFLVSQVKGNRFFIFFLFFTAIQGVLLSSLESYWQPFMKNLLVEEGQLWLLGIVGGMVFLVSISGSLAGNFLLKKIEARYLFLLAILLAFASELFLAFSKGVVSFCLFYALVYIQLGMVSVVGGGLLNLSIDSSIRSSSLSLNSLFLQGGGVVGALIALPVLKSGSIKLYWILVSLLGILFVAGFAKPLLKVSPGS
jgi:MFS family permease